MFSKIQEMLFGKKTHRSISEIENDIMVSFEQMERSRNSDDQYFYQHKLEKLDHEYKMAKKAMVTTE